ncbi:MAG TPA: NrfD/PsrC family molybdoenzyme membrane anchor subunit [Bryobacteraceae bacterium]|nr:NrfD/PsrC family molybdoenzyme membrane anchor subunit [Bryobacteraceae bacterium]
MAEALPGFVEIPGGSKAPMRSDDGRNIDPQLGLLLGDAAGQKPLASREDVALHSEIFPHVPSRQSTDSPSYYGVPVLKQPVWIWTIAAYFYIGGMSGMSATLGAAAQLFGGREMRGLVTKTRWIATVGGAMSSLLLIQDLGRPERFLHMLRVFKISSPMSMGSWILSAFSAAAGGAAVLPVAPRFLPRFASVFAPMTALCGVVAGLLGLPLAAYTGVLLVQTAVPIWRNPLWSVFALCSGTAAASSFLELLPLNANEARAVELFGFIGKVGELVFAKQLETEVAKVERVARPLQDGFTGMLWQTSKVLVIASAIVSLAPGHSRKKRILAGILGTAAGVCVRFAYFYAGKRSARDPRATFEQQRSTPAHVAGPI